MKFKLYKTIALTLTILISESALAQNIQIKNISKDNIPSSINYKGKVIESFEWNDKDGKHIVFNTETGEYNSKNDKDYRNSELFSYHYVVQNKSNKKIWEFSDSIKECPLDIEANFIKNTFHITDLDKNNVPEIWFMYKKVCHGDYSPSDMFILMFEGDKKYIVSGHNKIKISDKEYQGGDFILDKNFLKSKREFKIYANNLWVKNIFK